MVSMALSQHTVYYFLWRTKAIILPPLNLQPLQWRHNGRDSVSNHRPHDCLLNRLFRRRSKKTWKLRVTGICAGNSLGTGEFPAQKASYAENVSIWWRHHGRLGQVYGHTMEEQMSQSLCTVDAVSNKLSAHTRCLCFQLSRRSISHSSEVIWLHNKQF